MLRLLRAVAVLLALAATLPVAGGTQAAVGFWVATSGSDGNPGGANAPFRTIARAAEAVRALPRPLHQTVTVHVAAGDYPLDETLQLSGAADSGSSAEARVDYVAEGGRVRVLGGRVVPHHALLTNAHKLAQALPAATRTIDLKSSRNRGLRRTNRAWRLLQPPRQQRLSCLGATAADVQLWANARRSYAGTLILAVVKHAA